MPLRRTPIPSRAEAEDDGRRLVLTWGTETTRIDAVTLRRNCPCAGCVDEMTGERTLRDDSVDPEVRILEIARVGRYALQLGFSDGHATGLFTYASLSNGMT